MADGRLSYAKAKVISRYADDAFVNKLRDIAEGVPAGKLGIHLALWQKRNAGDDAISEAQHDARSLSWRGRFRRSVVRPEALDAPLRTSFVNMTNTAVNLEEKLATFTEHWSPRTVAVCNGHDVMVVKVQGEFDWHNHADTDDFFLVLSGRLTIRLGDGGVTLEPGELYVVPATVEHAPMAEVETHLLLIEPTGTPNSGDEATAAPRVVI